MVILKMRVQDYIIRGVKIFLIIFTLFVLYQLIKFILGGSWEKEDVITSLLMINIGITFSMAVNLARLNSDHKHLSSQFKSLASDFKKHLFEGRH